MHCMLQIEKSVQAVRSIIDESLTKEKISDYILSIQLGAGKTCFCILDSVRNKYIALQVFPQEKLFNNQELLNNFREKVKSDELLSYKNYKNINISIVHSNSTLVPVSLFNKKDSLAYLQFNHTVLADEVIHIDYIKAGNIRNIFAVPSYTLDILNELFPNADLRHYSTILIETLLHRFKNQNYKLVLHFQETHFEIIYIKEKKLIFYNTFNYQTTEDIIYYLLFVYEQLQLNPENIEVSIIGEVDKNSAVHIMIKKYIRNVKFEDRANDFSYSYGFNDISQHYYFILLNQNLCV